METLELNVDLNGKKHAVPAPIRRRVGNKIHEVCKGLHRHIPLDAIFDALKEEGLIPLQEDGTEWSGFLCGGAPCGSDEARQQVALLPLAHNRVKGGDKGLRQALAEGTSLDNEVVLTKLGLCISWGTMSSGKYEVVCYVN